MGQRIRTALLYKEREIALNNDMESEVQERELQLTKENPKRSANRIAQALSTIYSILMAAVHGTLLHNSKGEDFKPIELGLGFTQAIDLAWSCPLPGYTKIVAYQSRTQRMGLKKHSTILKVTDHPPNYIKMRFVYKATISPISLFC